MTAQHATWCVEYRNVGRRAPLSTTEWAVTERQAAETWFASLRRCGSIPKFPRPGVRFRFHVRHQKVRGWFKVFDMYVDRNNEVFADLVEEGPPRKGARVHEPIEQYA